jgi:hypothetical protein
MSDEQVVMDALGTNDAVESDWDNLEDTAPSMEEGVSEDVGEMDEWDALGDESESVEAKDNDNDESVQDSDSDSGEDPSETREAAEADVGDKEEADPASVEIPEALQEMGLVSQDGELGKMVKVDGEETFVSLKDLGNDFSGQKAISQRFNEYDRKEKEFNAQMEEVNDYINDLGATMRDQSILGGVQKIGELVGMAPHVLKEALIKEIAPELERRYGLSEEELALEYQRSENDYLREQTESNNQKLKAEQAQRELDATVVGLREAHNISSQEWQEHENALAGHYAKEEITPELVTNYHNFKQAESRADSIIDTFDSSYKSDSEVMDALVDQIYENPNLSNDAFREILETALGSSKKAEAEAKVEKAVESKAKSKPKAEVQDQMYNPITNEIGSEIDDWDDLL